LLHPCAEVGGTRPARGAVVTCGATEFREDLSEMKSNLH